MNRFSRVVLIAVLLIGMSGTPSSLTRATPVLDKIAPWVLEHTADGAEAEFLVVLAVQADLDGAARLQTKAEKGSYVYETLWRTAQTSQAPLLAWLEARGVEHRAYYIVNLIWVKGDATLARTLAARPDVARIEGNPRVHNALPQPERPLDVLLAAAPAAIESNITYVRAPEVWAMGFTGQGVVVGGQDTGYDWTHPALQPHYRGWDGVTADHDYNWHDSIHSGGGSCGADSSVPCDDYSHGTHTMGTVVGDDGGTNQIGMAPGAQWIGCRNMDVGVGTPATYLECFEFFLAPYPVGGTPAQGDPSKAPDVTNNSWTCPPSEGCSWSTLQDAVEVQRAAGIMTVVSASNSGPSCSTVDDPPAIYAAAYTVGALQTGTDTIWSGSSRGPVTVDGSDRRKPEIAAPGTGVRSCVLNGGYGSKTGTSMAAPHVAGAVALLWSARPALKNQIAETEQLLNSAAFHIASTACSSSGWPNNTYGYGRLDIKAAVDTTLVPIEYGATLTPTLLMQHGAPGQAVSTAFRITNAGTATDIYTVTLTGEHWQTTAPEKIGSLPVGETASLPVAVTIPADALCGASDTVTVTVTSAGDPTQSAQATLRTTADAVYAVTVRATESALGAMPGASVGTTVWVTNTGNCTDTFTVDSVAVWPVSAPDTTGVLAAGVGEPLPITVTVPLSASFGMYDVTILTATSKSNSTVSATARVTTTAGVVYGVQLWPPEIMSNGDVGKTVIYTLTLTNTGNITDVYSLALSRATWPTTLTPTLATLAPQATAPVAAMVTVPWDVFTGITDTARVTASGTGVSAYSDLTTAAIAAGCIPVIDPYFSYAPSHPLVGQMITFTGEVALGTQPVDYVWDFGDDSPVAYGQVVTHTFPAATATLPYTVIMTAINPCSEETVQRVVTVEPYRLYLPVVLKSSETVFMPMQASVPVMEDGAPLGGAPSNGAPTFQDGGPWVVRAYYTDEQMVRDLAAWNEPWEVHRDARYVVVEVDADAYARLLVAGFRVEIDTSLTTQLRQPNVMLPDQVAGIPGYPCYRTVEETFATAEAIVAAYPTLATWIDIGDSWEKTVAGGDPGYDLMVLRLTNQAIPGPKPKLFVMSSVHAREYTPAELNTRFAEYLVEHYGVDADVTWVLDYHEIHLLLQANPDGRKKAEAGLSWRKNTNENYCLLDPNLHGADLNRNFEFQWGCCHGSSGNPCDLTYRGPTPASEPETQAVQDYVRAEFPDQRADDLTAAAPLTATGIFLDVHSYSELVLWSWGFTGDPSPNSASLQTLGRKFAYFNGYMPEQAMTLYPTDGTTDDFAYGKLGLAAYTFELGTAFFQSCTAFENTILPANMPALLYAAKAARTPYMTPSGPEALDVSVVPTGTLFVPTAQVSATIDDTRYSNNNGIEPTQIIIAAEYYVDVPPWDETATAYPMAAADGSFDASVEVVTAMLNVTGLSAGQHTLYVRGQDVAGNWGVVSATYVTVSESLSWPFAVYLPVVTQE